MKLNSNAGVRVRAVFLPNGRLAVSYRNEIRLGRIKALPSPDKAMVWASHRATTNVVEGNRISNRTDRHARLGPDEVGVYFPLLPGAHSPPFTAQALDPKTLHALGATDGVSRDGLLKVPMHRLPQAKGRRNR